MCELALPGTQELASCQSVLPGWEDSCTSKLCMWILVPTYCLRTFFSIAVTCAEYYVPKQSPVLYVKMSANCITVFSVYCDMKYSNIFLQNILALL